MYCGQSKFLGPSSSFFPYLRLILLSSLREKHWNMLNGHPSQPLDSNMTHTMFCAILIYGSKSGRILSMNGQLVRMQSLVFLLLKTVIHAETYVGNYSMNEHRRKMGVIDSTLIRRLLDSTTMLRQSDS